MSYDNKPRQTKNDKEVKYKYLMALLHGGNHPKFDNGWYVGFENEPEVIMYKKYLAMSDLEKASLNLAWENYYQDVWETHEGQRFTQMRIAFELGDMSSVKELNREEMKEKPMLKKPSSVSPEDLVRDSNVKKYFKVKETLKEMDAEGLDQSMLKERAEIFETPAYWNK